METRWYRLKPKQKGLQTLILELEQEEIAEYEEYGYVVEPVVVIAQSAYDALVAKKGKGK